jgi:hypothetical protein
MQKRQLWFVILVIGLGLSLLSCSGSESFAPKSIGGKKYQVVITGGSGEMTDTGNATISFAMNGSYVVTGDGVNTSNDLGTYTYNKTGKNTGAFTLNSTLLKGYQESNIFEFVDKKSGTYKAKTLTGDPGDQAGNFNEIEVQ